MSRHYNVFPYVEDRDNDCGLNVLMYDDVMQDIIENQQSLWNYELWRVGETNNYTNQKELVENYLQQITSKILACWNEDPKSYHEYLTGGDPDFDSSFRCFNLGLRCSNLDPEKNGRYMLLYMISKAQLSKEHEGSKYWNCLGDDLKSNKDRIVNFMSDKNYDYIAFKVDVASFIDKECPYKSLKQTEPVDFYKNDLCRMYINLEKITKTVENSANFRHLSNDADNKDRLPDNIKSISDDDKRLLKVQEMVIDAMDRLRRNPRLAIPYGINKGNKEKNIRSQFLIPVFENKFKQRPFGALVARCKVMEDEAKSKAKVLDSNVAEFSSCSYDFPTLLDLKMAVIDSLAYVNLDKNIWCNIR